MTAIQQLLQREQSDETYKRHVNRLALEQALAEEIESQVLQEACIIYGEDSACIEFPGYFPIRVFQKIDESGIGWTLEFVTSGTRERPLLAMSYRLVDALVQLDDSRCRKRDTVARFESNVLTSLQSPAFH